MEIDDENVPPVNHSSTDGLRLTDSYVAPGAPLVSHSGIPTSVSRNVGKGSYNVDGEYNVERAQTAIPRQKRNVVPLSEKISYDIGKDLFTRKADIDVKDLIIAVPALKRDLLKAVREVTKNPTSHATLAFVEDDDVDTTAIYTEVHINGYKIRAIVDTGSAKTVISKNLADKLSLNIDAPSSSVFVLGNGSKQAALGLIYDVPLNIGGQLVIPGSIEVLPVCPSHLILGTNWMKRAKAKLNLEERVIKVSYKGLNASVPFNYERTSDKKEHIVKINNVKYFYDQSKNKKASSSKTLPTIEDSSDSDIDEVLDDDSSDTDELEPDSSDEETDGSELMFLEDTHNELNSPTTGQHVHITKHPSAEATYLLSINKKFYLPPYSETSYTISLKDLGAKDQTNFENFKFLCDFSNDKLIDLDSMFYPSSSYIDQTESELILNLVNTSPNTLEFDEDEELAELEIIFNDDIDVCECYKIKKNREKPIGLMVHETLTTSDDLTAYEEKIQDKMDMSDIPPSIKPQFLALINAYDH